jgi:prolyl oligopeptidase
MNDISPTRRGVITGVLSAGATAAMIPALGQNLPQTTNALRPPRAPRDRTVEILHGIRVPDPFRPLENPARADVARWIDAQDGRTRGYLATLPTRAAFRKFSEELLNFPRWGISDRYGDLFFTFFNDGLALQNSYVVQEQLDGPRRTLIDPLVIDKTGTTSISDAFPNRDGTKVAYGLSKAGSDQQILYVREVATGTDLPDKLLWCKHVSVAWRADGQSFFYSRYPADHDPAGWDRQSQIVALHRLSEPQSADRVVFRLPGLANAGFTLESAFDTGVLKISCSTGTSDEQGYYITSLEDPSLVSELVASNVAGFQALDNLGTTHYAMTNLNAPNWRLVSFEQSDPKPERWRTIIPESGKGPLEAAVVFEKYLVAKHTENLSARVTIRDLEGHVLSAADLSDFTNVTFGHSNEDAEDLLLEVRSYQHLVRIERLDLTTGKTTLVRPSGAKHDLADAVVRQVFAISKDGTRVSMLLIHRAGIELDGGNRTLLYGYGGYGAFETPAFNVRAAAWVRAGGVYAVANIRGGGEFGQHWHDGGRLAKKQNSFDDFIACAEWLITNKYTEPKRLGINGNSNGGLLVLACMLQRPDLFGAVTAEVPAADMLRFHRFTFGSDWIVEFGDPKVAADFKVLFAYSPLHNVRSGVKYPPLLVLTADNDDRVVPAHSYKFVATIQDIAPDSETYLRVEREAGHGGGDGLEKTLDQNTDILAFLCDKLGGPVVDFPKLKN